MLLTLAMVARADVCADLEATTRKSVAELQAVSARAADAAVTCTFHGSNDALLESLRSGFRGAVQTMETAHGTCPTLTASLQTLLEQQAHSTGERMGFAFCLCSSAARAKITAMVAAGRTQPEVEQAIGQMSGDWMVATVKPAP